VARRIGPVALVDARVSCDAAGPSECVLEQSAADGAGLPAIAISAGASGAVVVDTSAARFTIGPGVAFPFLDVERAGKAGR